ncbi:hypothetical protein HDU67_002668 [Dinochytrium kinnereticum]|nr:hypothetical protein HDU67_002668 [Dinochytrium kinnereticum]
MVSDASTSTAAGKWCIGLVEDSDQDSVSSASSASSDSDIDDAHFPTHGSHHPKNKPVRFIFKLGGFNYEWPKREPGFRQKREEKVESFDGLVARIRGLVEENKGLSEEVRGALDLRIRKRLTKEVNRIERDIGRFNEGIPLDTGNGASEKHPFIFTSHPPIPIHPPHFPHPPHPSHPPHYTTHMPSPPPPPHPVHPPYPTHMPPPPHSTGPTPSNSSHRKNMETHARKMQKHQQKMEKYQTKMRKLGEVMALHAFSAGAQPSDGATGNWYFVPAEADGKVGDDKRREEGGNE